jgi:hypothetical protein
MDVTSGFRRYVDEICALLGCYAAYSGNSLPTFRDNLLIPSSRDLRKIKEEKSEGTWISWKSLRMELTGCSETSVRNYHYTLCNIPKQRRSLRYVQPQSSVCFLSWGETPWRKRLFSSKSPKPAPWPTRSFLGSKTSVCEFNHSPPSSTKLRMRGALCLHWYWQGQIYFFTCQNLATSRVIPSAVVLHRRASKSESTTQGRRDFSGHGKLKSPKK